MITLSASGWKSGLREWIIQRFTGLYIGIYFLFIFYYLFFCDGLNYNNWSVLFLSFFFKILTLLFVFSLILHSSIGMGIILTDYIKNSYIRVFFDFFINLILLSYIFSVMQILWGFK